MGIRVFKFGGASVNTADRIKKAESIIRHQPSDKILIVISAMGKTTNALEKVAEAFFQNRQEEALQLFQQVKDFHETIAKYLLLKNALSAENQLKDIFTEVEWLLHDEPVREFDYYYDQIVCTGELLSTVIISAYFNEAGLSNYWLDVRDIIRTDQHFREGNIDWSYTEEKVLNVVKPLLEQHRLLITQGFIGSTSENESTTLGREGSDYTAAVFANMLEAESQTIWKDVEGVMNADPKQFPEAVVIPELNYDEVIEMAYYGAQVIHPKTIKPLENKKIPLFVKCFLDPSLPGTIIHHKHIKGLPPIIVLKQNQVLFHFHSKDFSFVGEKTVSHLYHLLSEFQIRPNLVQTGAVTLQLCTDDVPGKTEKLAAAADHIFDVELERGLTLLTIRHPEPDSMKKMIRERLPVLQQQSPETLQVLLR